jgi:two-component system, sporulation sensor kinase C
MLANSPSLVSLALLTLFITLLYFYIFSKNHEAYINYWALSWSFYTVSLFSSILLLNHPGLKVLIGLKVICDLLSSLFLLGGTYLFVDKKIPRYWIQFLFINLLWITLAVYYDLSILTITLLASVFFSAIAVVTGLMLVKYWEVNLIERVLGALVFIAWGLHKAYYPYIFPEFWESPLGYTSEIIFANILNFSILIIYLLKIRSQLTDSEKRFRFLADNAKDLIYLYRLIPEGHFEYISPSSMTMLGYQPEEFYEKPDLFVQLTHPEDHPLISLLKEPDHLNPGPVTIRFLHKTGRYIWTEQQTTLVCNKAGEVSAIQGIARDITDRKKMEEDMIQAEKSRHSLLTNISHELRTPITSILGYVSALIDGTISLQETKINYMHLIHTKSIRLQRLIQDLFELTQLESGQTSFNFSQLSVNEFVTELISKYEWDVNHAGVRFHLDHSVDPSHRNIDIILDVERIDQVLSNLVFNAIKHTPPNGLITISVTSFTEGRLVKLLVRIIDNGIGIEEKDLEHIFERFYKGSSHLKAGYAGSGLGLTISKEIVEFHNGMIWAESIPNQGSTFCFTLPLYHPY